MDRTTTCIEQGTQTEDSTGALDQGSFSFVDLACARCHSVNNVHDDDTDDDTLSLNSSADNADDFSIGSSSSSGSTNINDWDDGNSFCSSYSCSSLDYDATDRGDRTYHPSEEERVRFGFVQVREYAITVGDASIKMDTCPITLSWDHSGTKTFALHDYEKMSYRAKWNKVRQSNRGASSSNGKEMPKLQKLSLGERRQRVAITQGITMRQVSELEIAMLAQRVEELMIESTCTMTMKTTSKTIDHTIKSKGDTAPIIYNRFATTPQRRVSNIAGVA